MPELPEVETIARQLNARIAGRRLVAVELWRTGRESPVGTKFVQALLGRRIERVFRRAKLLVFSFDDSRAMVGHLKMTGRFAFVPPDYVQGKHDRALFVFDDGCRVVWADVRQFGYLHVISSDEVARTLSTYGLEPLEHPVEMLAEALRLPGTRTIKAALLHQGALAGVGNIYADEACHRAGIRPTRRLRTLTRNDRLRLITHLKDVLNESIVQKGTSANDYVDADGARGGFLSLLRVYGREGEPCRSCGHVIKKIAHVQRGTHYCPTCQK